MPMPDTLPMSRTQFEARQLVEALRVGVAPAQHIQELTIGLVEERATLSAGIVQAHQTGGGALAVLGDYGYGKSHIVELTAQDALDWGFLVAAASLDLLELPAHRAFDVYAALMRNLRYPDGDERGLGVLMEKVRGNRRLHDELRELAPAWTTIPWPWPSMPWTTPPPPVSAGPGRTGSAAGARSRA